MKTLNAVDLERELARLYWQIHLHVEDIRHNMAYDHATTWCSNCPGSEYSDCCKNDGSWDEDNESTWDYVHKLDQVKITIAAAVSEAALTEAKTSKD